MKRGKIREVRSHKSSAAKWYYNGCFLWVVIQLGDDIILDSRFIFTCLSFFFFHEIALLRDLFFLTEPRRSMAKFYLKFDTMKLIVKASACCSLENILTSK
jgi:hypothetical protein